MSNFRRFKRGCTAGVALAVPSVSVVTTARPVAAFNETFGACGPVHNSSATFLFELKALVGAGPTVVTWSPDAQTLFNAGVANWERLRNDANTAPEIDFIASASSPNRWQILRGVPGSSADINGDGVADGQSAACLNAGSGSRIIQIASREDQPTTFRRTTVHETGHALGAPHTGKCDSRPVSGSATNVHPLATSWPGLPFCTGQQPVDSTNCGPGSSTSSLPTADDYSAMMYRRSGKQITTNGGFESTLLPSTDVGQSWRGAYSVANVSPFQGARYAEIPNNASIRQQVVILNPTTVGSPATSQAIAQARYKSNGTSTGKVVVRKRHITNTGHDSCTVGDVPGPWDPNAWTSIGPLIDVGSYQFNSGGNGSSWALLSPPASTVTNASGNTSSIFLEIEVVNTTGGPLWVDNVSLRFTG